jgi:hypothetical protein
MVVHTCTKCLKEFSRKSDYIYHTIKKKNPCIQINIINTPILVQNPEIILQKPPENIINYTCLYCQSVFKRKDNLARHVKERCKVKKLQDEEKEKIFDKLVEKDKKMNKIIKNCELLQKQNEELQKQLKSQAQDYDNKIKTIINKITTKNINNGIINNIMISPQKLVEFGKENLDKINIKHLTNTITRKNFIGVSGFIELLRVIHFNDEYPENKNIYMNDKNRNQFMIYNGVDWQLVQKNIIYEITDNIKNFVDLKLEEIEERINKDNKLKETIHAIFFKYYNMYYDETDEETKERKEEFKNMVDKKIALFLYNNRQKVINNYEQLLIEENKNFIIKY